MKRNYFGDPIFQPGDSDPFLVFFERFGIDPGEVTLTAEFIEQDSEFGWTCSIMADSTGDELQAHDFESEEALKAWLTDVGVSVG